MTGHDLRSRLGENGRQINGFGTNEIEAIPAFIGAAERERIVAFAGTGKPPKPAENRIFLAHRAIQRARYFVRQENICGTRTAPM